MRRPSYMSTLSINFSAMTQKIDVDNRTSLRNYYRIADNLLKQSNIYREEKNLIDLYIILYRYSSLVSETIPYHRDYQALHPKERTFYKKKLLAVMDELEALKPKVRCQLDELDRVKKATQVQIDVGNHYSKASLSYYSNKQIFEFTSSKARDIVQAFIIRSERSSCSMVSECCDEG